MTVCACHRVCVDARVCCTATDTDGHLFRGKRIRSERVVDEFKKGGMDWETKFLCSLSLFFLSLSLSLG